MGLHQNIIYEITEEENIYDGKKYTCYGIVALIILNNTKTKVDKILDISTDFKFVKKLVDDFNNYDLHIEHFYDVVYDSLCAEFTV